MTDPVVSTPAVIGARPRPRLLIINAPDGSAEKLGALVPHHVSVDRYDQIRTTEFDVVVVWHSGSSNTRLADGRYATWPAGNTRDVLPEDDPPFAMVLCGPVPLESVRLIIDSSANPEAERLAAIHDAATQITRLEGRAPPPAPVVSPRRSEVRAVRGRPCTEFAVHHDQPPLGGLIREDLAPACRRRENQLQSPVFTTDGTIEIDPFLAGTDGQILGGRYPRGQNGEAWLLPSDVDDPTTWLDVALRHWRVLQPDRFRELPSPGDDPRWQTVNEREINAQLASLDEERRVAVAAFEERRHALEHNLADARAEADRGTRLLLTGEGDALVGAVHSAFEQLGFEVEDIDEARKESRSDLLEDLRVTDRDDPDWIALVEVRSYKGGAKSADLIRLGRFASRYQSELGEPPGALWYIVNQFRERDPGTPDRLPMLPSQPEDVEAFALSGGVLIDTTQLFELVEREDRDDRQIRESLRGLTGRLGLTSFS